MYVYESEEHLRSIRVWDSGRDFRRFELVYFFLFQFLLSVNLYSMEKPWLYNIFPFMNIIWGILKCKIEIKNTSQIDKHISQISQIFKDYILYMEINISAKSLLAFYGFMISSIVNIRKRTIMTGFVINVYCKIVIYHSDFKDIPV